MISEYPARGGVWDFMKILTTRRPGWRLPLVFGIGLMTASAKPHPLPENRVFCGYQGWFRCEGDGAKNGWFHYAAGGKFEPGNVNIDLWPDVSELGKDERFPTPFQHADGSTAEVFSSVHPATVRRHFKWMREYGIDAAFVQRFATSTMDPKFRGPMDKVLGHCIAAAKAERREWVLMYDLSGLKPADFEKVPEDWKRLHKGGPMKAADPSYLMAGNVRLVALWGLGFNDRPAALDEWRKLIRFFHSESCAVMVGVPCYWRTLERDTIQDPRLLEIIAEADVISPWSVGRFGTPEEAAKRTQSLLEPDLAWCRERGIGYLPVVFPGFSWHNLRKSRGQVAKPDAIPRLGGRFLWSQAVAAKSAGANSVYIAMFDEMDEGTAIFKTSTHPPVGASPFVADKDLPSDHYLWLSGRIGPLLRGEIGPDLPTR